MPTNTRTARIIRQRRNNRLRRGGNAVRLGRWIGCSIGTILIIIMVLWIGAIGSIVGVYALYARELPPAEAMVSAQAEAFQTSIFYDRSGTSKIYEVIDPSGGDRQYISIDDVPKYFLEATIAIEDKSFYDNPGFDVEGILRAVWANVTSEQLQGGSTITQQLVKNVLIPAEERNEISVDRKLKEIILAAELSRLYSKNQILEWYINTNFYGNLAYGVEAAARVYFDKSARDLTLAEATLLAAIPQSPTQNPLNAPEAARERQITVLQAMVEQNYISQNEMDAALAETIVISSLSQRFDLVAPHFALYARDEAEAILNNLGYDGADMILRKGLRVYTTLDLDLQLQMECVARIHVTRLATGDRSYQHNTRTGTPCVAEEFLPPISDQTATANRPVTNAAGVIIRPETGEILGMLGSVDYNSQVIQGQVNVALALRQPASTFKPFVYVTAFVNPIDSATVVTPATMTYDVRTLFNNGQPEPYIPENIDFVFHGPVSVREALARSYNVPAVQVLNWVGLRRVLDTAHLMGINSMRGGLSNFGLSLALGTAEATLLDMTYAYNVFNNNGVMVGTPVFEAEGGYRQLNPVAILRIEDANGKILWAYGEEYGTFDRRSVLEAGMAYMITDILSDNEARISAYFPRGNALELTRPAAVKTGTSDNYRDSWTIGYTPQYTMGFWVGNNDSSSMIDVTGLIGAAPIWHAMMEYAHAKNALPVETWAQPDTIVQQDVCRISGLLPNGICLTTSEIFFSDPRRNIDYRPNRVDPYWIEVRVNTCNNTLAVNDSPPECVAEKVYFAYPPELEAWKTASGADTPPTVYDTVSSTSLFSPVAILSPQLLDQVSGVVEIQGNARDENFAYYRLEVGAGSFPESWRQIGENQTEGGGNIILGTWDTTQLPDGVYTLRLIVVREDNTTSEPANREVIVDNTAPRVRLLAPRADTIYSQSQDVFLELDAEPADNRQVDYVDFYLDGEFLGRVIEGAYTYRWEISKTGTAEFWAVVGDKAGNEAESEHINVQLTP